MTQADPHRRGAKWLPADPDVHSAWLAQLINEVQRSDQPLHPVVEEFQRFIESDPTAYMLFHQLFEESAASLPNEGPARTARIRDYKMLLKVFNALLTRAPKFDRSGVVGTPFAAVLDQLVRTRAGFTIFLQDRVNEHLRNIFNEWGRYLRSTDSCAVLTDDPDHGWFGRDAMGQMPTFMRDFECDAGSPHMGFTSWDEFFTRRFRPGVRPVESTQDDAVVVSPCEAAPYRISDGAKEADRFWIKSQKYSLSHMLAADEFAGQFFGGSVYQAYLSALSYHRWHSPVSGTIVKAYLVPGAYFSEPPAEASDPTAASDSPAYLTEVATRGLIFIRADNPKIGLMCFMPVGMGEVSTCEITAYEGQQVAKGDPLGMFHFGGSTCRMVFRPGVKLTYDFHGQRPGANAKPIPVCSTLARGG